ncbi:hypothetical protein PENTCL1PPCAC_15497, partial [Pristionchus entomophagus]
ICAVPSLLLLLAVLRSSIHANCRIMLCMWAVAQLLVYITACWLSVQYIFFEEEYFTNDYNPTIMRTYILRWYGCSWFTCTCIELGIGLERAISIRNPSEYYKSTASYFAIFAYAICSRDHSLVRETREHAK